MQKVNHQPQLRVLSHLTQRFGSDDYTLWAEEVKKDVSGQVLIAKDLMEY